MTPLLIFLVGLYAVGFAVAIYAYRQAPQIDDLSPVVAAIDGNPVTSLGRAKECNCRRCLQRHARQLRVLRKRHSRLHLRSSPMGARVGSFKANLPAQ